MDPHIKRSCPNGDAMVIQNDSRKRFPKDSPNDSLQRFQTKISQNDSHQRFFQEDSPKRFPKKIDSRKRFPKRFPKKILQKDSQTHLCFLFIHFAASVSKVPGQTKIWDFTTPSVVKKDIPGSQISVDDLKKTIENQYLNSYKNLSGYRTKICLKNKSGKKVGFFNLLT